MRRRKKGVEGEGELNLTPDDDEVEVE